MALSMTMLVAVAMCMMMAVIAAFQHYVKIHGLYAVFIGTAKPQGVSFQMQAGQGLFQFFTAGSQIQQSRHRHVAADAGITL